MESIQDIIDKMKSGQYDIDKLEVCYFDEECNDLTMISFDDIIFKDSTDLYFEYVNDLGDVLNISFDKIKVIWRNEKILWLNKS